jgi:hypothetical protein
MTAMDLDIIDLTEIVGDVTLAPTAELPLVHDLMLSLPVSATGKWTSRDPALARLYGPTEVRDGCLVRTTRPDAKGYTILTIKGVTWRAHRLAWTVWRGAIGDGLTIDHLCEQPACVYTGHMEEVTVEENSIRRHWRGGVCQNGHDVTDPANVTVSGSNRQFRRCRPCWNAYMREHRRQS